jgi:hypothetical protein
MASTEQAVAPTQEHAESPADTSSQVSVIFLHTSVEETAAGVQQALSRAAVAHTCKTSSAVEGEEKAILRVTALDRRHRRRSVDMQRFRDLVTRLESHLRWANSERDLLQNELYRVSSERSQQTAQQNLTPQLLQRYRWAREFKRTEQELRGAALVLTGLAEHVDGPVEIDHENVSMTWKTTDIYLRNPLGGWLPKNYGRFKISLRVSSGTFSTGLDVDVDPLDASVHYPHPHISGSNPCLGDGQALLLEALQEEDYAAVVSIMTEFMTVYSDANPYRKISDFGDLSPWIVPTCSGCAAMVSDCTCSRCLSCGRLADGHPTARLFIQDCGSCSTCCSLRHFQQLDAHGDQGISGSSCLTVLPV